MRSFKDLVNNRIKEFYKKFETSYEFRKELVKSYELEELYGDRDKLKSLYIYCGPNEWNGPTVLCMWQPKDTCKWESIEFSNSILLLKYIKDYFRKEFPDMRLSTSELYYIHQRADEAGWDIKVFNRDINYVDEF